MIHQTKAIILQSVKYGETSLVVTAYTSEFGLQTFMLKGIRSQKKGGSKVGMFQPVALLDLIMHHNELKNMQLIKEASWATIYQQLLSDVVKNSMAVFMIELLHKTLRQPEKNMKLFLFVEDSLLHLDNADNKSAANFPLFFALNLADFFGFKLHPNPKLASPFYLDLREGIFTSEQPQHPQFLEPNLAQIISELLMMRQPEEFRQLSLNKQVRRNLLLAIEDYYVWHVPGFKRLRTLQVLNEVL